MAEGFQGEVGIGVEQGSARWSFANLFVELNAQWPMLKFMAFGFYYAWIWLMYSSSLMTAGSSQAIVSDMYLISTTVLVFMLAASALLYRKVEKMLYKRAFMLAAGFMACAGTFLVGFLGGFDQAILVFGNILTAAGTCFFVLRLGQLFGSIGLRESLMAGGMSFVVAAGLFFMASGIGRTLGIVFTALLPFLGVLLLFLDTESEALRKADIGLRTVDGRSLAGLFIRLIIGIFLISFAISTARGYVAFADHTEGSLPTGSLMIIGTAFVSLMMLLAVGLSSRKTNLAKAYIPAMVIVVACFVVLSLFPEGTFEFVDALGVGYAFLGLIVWCLFSAISYMGSVSPVFIFGWGRCAWSAAATSGWFAGRFLFSVSQENSFAVTAVMICMGFLVVVTVLLVLGEKHIEDMLTFMPDPAEGEVPSDAAFGLWKRRCMEVADTFGLSPRETEVFLLLAKGRTVEYIADACGVSVNTSKAHVRHVYVKIDVHTRQELLDLVESF